MTLFEGNLPQKRRRKRKKKKERKKASKQASKKERERESERASSMPNDMATAGNRAPQFEFLSSVLPVLWMCICLVYAKFNGLSCMVPRLSLLGGPYRFTVFRAHLWQKTPTILKWSSTIFKSGWGLQLFTVPLYKSPLNSWLHSSQVTKYAHLPS